MPKSMMSALSVGVDHDVGRLEIAMDDPGLVRRRQAGATCRAIATARDRRSRPSRLRIVARSAPVDVRHRDVLDAVDLAEIVDADDVLVRDLARQQQLALEPPFDVAGHARILGDLRADHLDRNGLTELVVPRLIDRAHAAHAEQADDVIATTAERGAWFQRTEGMGRPRNAETGGRVDRRVRERRVVLG